MNKEAVEQSAQDNTGSAEETSSILKGEAENMPPEDNGENTQNSDAKEEKPKEPEDKTGDKEENREEKKEPEGAPEKYEAFSVPEGMALNEPLTEKFSEIAKSKNLSQKDAQELITLAAENMQQEVRRQAEAWAETRTQWRSEIENDSEFGGRNFRETETRANRALKKFGSPELSKLLVETGYGDNPELVKVFARVDKATCEDSIIDGKAPGGSERTRAERIFPNQT